MCRKNHLHGCCCLFFGLGLIVGHCVSSWFVCCCGGIDFWLSDFALCEEDDIRLS